MQQQCNNTMYIEITCGKYINGYNKILTIIKYLNMYTKHKTFLLRKRTNTPLEISFLLQSLVMAGHYAFYNFFPNRNFTLKKCVLQILFTML